jgi:hypothetical protein
MPNSKTDESSFAQRMSDVGGLKITKAKGPNMAEPPTLPEGWRAQQTPPEAEMNSSNETDMSEDEYEYWKAACASCEEVDAAEGNGKKYTHTYKDPKTGNTRKVRYGAKGYTIAPGTKRGDSYCARSEGDMKSHGKDCSGADKNTPMCLSRKKWRCHGAKSV